MPPRSEEDKAGLVLLRMNCEPHTYEVGVF